MVNDARDTAVHDDPGFIHARLLAADALMAGTAAQRREGMLVYRELIDHIHPDTVDGAERIVSIALAPGTVDPAFESRFGEVAALSTDADHVRATSLAAAQLSMQRGEHARAEAALRRNLRSVSTAEQRADAIQRLGALWMRQGMEHEATVAARLAGEVPDASADSAAFRHAHVLAAHGVRMDWSAVIEELARWERACAMLPPVGGRPSGPTVALFAAHAHLHLGDLVSARRWLDAVNPELAEPAHAEVLRPAVAFRAAQIAAAAKDYARAAEVALIVGREPRSMTSVRLDAFVLAIECLAKCGATVRAAGVTEDWASLLLSERQRLGSGFVIRSVRQAVPLVAEVTRDRSVPDLVTGALWDALADRLEELARHAQDPDLPPGPADENPLRAFRARFASAGRAPAAPPVGDRAMARAAGVLGPGWRTCRTCLRVERRIGPPLPVGHLIAGFNGRADDVATCAGCTGGR